MRDWLTAIVLMSLVFGLAQPKASARQQVASGNQVAVEESKLRGFTVSLVLGEIESGRTAGTFSPAAAKALADLKDFLPYKSYRLLDTTWMIGLTSTNQFLRDADGQQHGFFLRSTLISPSAVKVDMLRLWGVASSAPKSSPELLIDTSFNLKVGETIVVGTSRIDSDRGLILLVTAASR